jgi:hypothetical protein
MKFLFQIGLASVFVLMMGLAPARAYASKKAGSTHTHSQTYHDRTPTVHTHTEHQHHQR